MTDLGRFKKTVQKYGNSKIIRVPDMEDGQEVLVMTVGEFNMFLNNNNNCSEED